MQIRSQILSGALAEDAALPSIRSLAKDLSISVITTKRAYDELESAGLIYTLPGKGSFVAAGRRGLLLEERLRELDACLRRVRALAADCGLDREALARRYSLTEMEDPHEQH